MQSENLKNQFIELYDKHKRELSNYARALCKDSESAKDLVGDTILIAYERFHTIKNTDSFKSYLFTVAHRAYLKKYRKSRIFSYFYSQEDDQVATAEPSIKGNQAEIDHDVEVLYRMIDRLPYKQKEAIVLFEISGFSLEEIKELQGGTLSGVKSRVKRARESLRAMLITSESKLNNSIIIETTNKTETNGQELSNAGTGQLLLKLKSSINAEI